MSLSINELPVELLLTIIDHLDDAKTLESLALVSHHFYRVTQPPSPRSMLRCRSLEY